jgi:folylpolyglutamate synthase/dihydropteroate synthase
MPWVRATHSDELARSIEEMGLDGITVDQYADVERALEKGSEVNESIVVAGSLYLVADTLRMVRRGSQQ